MKQISRTYKLFTHMAFSFLCSFLHAEVTQEGAQQVINLKRYDTIIFDFGGVILDEASAPACIAKTWPDSKERLMIFKKLYDQDLWFKLMRGSLTEKEVSDEMEKKHGFPSAVTHNLLEELPKLLGYLPSGLEMLKQAKEQGYKVYLLSNMYQACIKTFLQHPSLKLFDGIVFSCEEGYNKPDPEIYQILINRYNINPATALFIDDREDNVVGATHCGIDGIVCKNSDETLKFLQALNILQPHHSGSHMESNVSSQSSKMTNDPIPQIKKQYKSVIFDLGGVLLDTSNVFTQVQNRWPHTQTGDILQALFKEPLLKNLYAGTISIDEAASQVEATYGYDKVITKEILANLDQCLPVIPAGITMLHTAKSQGYKVYLLTDIYKECLAALKNSHSFFNLFDGIIVSCEVGSDKSQALPFERLLSDYAINPYEALLIDDTENFVEKATEFGIDGIVCDNPQNILNFLRSEDILKKKPAHAQSRETVLIQSSTALPLNEKKYTALVFDLGKVLIDWNPEAVMENIFPQSIAPSIINTLFHDPHWLNFDSNTIDINGLVTLATSRYFFDTDFTKKILTQLPYHLTDYDVMVNILAAAKKQGLKLYVLSNMPQPYMEVFIKNKPYFKLFDGIVGSYEIGSLKPERSIYEHLFKKYSLNPGECLFIDDLQENILAGAELGMDGIVCQNHAAVVDLLTKNKILQATD